MKKSILFGIVAIVILVVGLVAAAVFYQFGFRQRFEVVSAAKIKVFTNPELTNELQQGQTLTWGTIGSTEPQHQTLYVKNTGTVNVTLQFNHDAQTIPPDWSLSWDYGGSPVLTGENVTVTMTLTLPSTISEGQWECNSWIQATPVP